MRILLWHGYLLGGTGSNVYSRALAREWSRGGHEVVVVSQERAPEQYDLGGAQAVAVDLPGRLLPVFVMDRYEGLEPKFLQDFSEAERRAYVDANAAALRALLPADLVFTNHVLMGGTVAQRSRTCSQRPARIHRTAATSACPTTATRSAWPRFSTASGRSSFTSGS